MEFRTKAFVGFLVIAGVVFAWMAKDDPPTPAVKPLQTGTANTAPPPERIPGLPYPAASNQTTRSQPPAIAQHHVFKEEKGLATSRPYSPGGYQFRPTETGKQATKRYQPYGAPSAGPEYELFGMPDYGRMDPTPFGEARGPTAPNSLFRPLNGDPGARYRREQFHQMAVSPAALASPGGSANRAPRPT